MKHKSKDVSKPSRPRYDRPPGAGQQRGAVAPGTIPPTAQVPKPLPPIEPARPVSGFAGSGIRSRETPTTTFKLPEKVSTKEIKAGSFKYGGSRSSGNRSIATNRTRQYRQP